MALKDFFNGKNGGSTKTFPVFIQLFTHRYVHNITSVILQLELFDYGWWWKGTRQIYKPCPALHPCDFKHKQPMCCHLESESILWFRLCT